MSLFKNMFLNIYHNVEAFFFSPQNLLSVAFTRILVSSSLLYMAITTHPGSSLFYAESGMYSKELALKVIPEFIRPPFLYYFWPDSLVNTIHWIYILLLALMLLGIGGRKIGWALWFLHISHVHRNLSVVYGADLIGGLFLFYLAFMQTDARLSVLNLFRKTIKPKLCDFVTSAGVRMMQIQLCSIYAYTGMEKLKGGTWWDGTALWYVLNNPQQAIMDLSFVRFFPIVIAAITFLTLIFEVYFPVLIWLKSWRKVIVGFGILFHLGIAASINLWDFSLVMIAPYFLFLSLPQDLPKFLRRGVLKT